MRSPSSKTKCAIVTFLLWSILTPCSASYASAKKQDDETKKKYQELAVLCAGLKQELDDANHNLELHKRRLEVMKGENENLRKELLENDTVQDPTTASLLKGKDDEIENTKKMVDLWKNRVSELEKELDRVRAERDALRGTPWLKIAVAAIVGLGIGLAVDK